MTDHTFLTFLETILRPLGTVLMLVSFVGIAAWAYWPSRRKEMEDHANILFRDDHQDSI